MSSSFSSGVVGDATNNLLYDAVELVKKAMTKTVDLKISCNNKLFRKDWELPLATVVSSVIKNQDGKVVVDPTLLYQISL